MASWLALCCLFKFIGINATIIETKSWSIFHIIPWINLWCTQAVGASESLWMRIKNTKLSLYRIFTMGALRCHSMRFGIVWFCRTVVVALHICLHGMRKDAREDKFPFIVGLFFPFNTRVFHIMWQPIGCVIRIHMQRHTHANNTKCLFHTVYVNKIVNSHNA